jgi:hypothetical protein
MKVARNLLFRCGYKTDKMRNFIVNESIWFDYVLQHTLLFNYSNVCNMLSLSNAHPDQINQLRCC